MVKSKLSYGLALVLLVGTSIAWADSLELKNGSLIKGKFLGGTDTEISFQVGSSVQKYNLSDIVSIKFFDSDKTASDLPKTSDALKMTDLPKQADSSLPEAPKPVVTPVYLTIPAGTLVSVRTIDSIDSTQNSVGDRFRATLAEPLMVDETVVVPRGADVYGRLIASRESGTFTGSSQLRLELTGIVVNGQVVPLLTGEYALTGKSRGASTAKRTIGGAAVGSIIGAIAGGGEGAAIGAGAGAAVGAGSEIVTKGDQVRIPSETFLDFALQRDVTIATTRKS
jgi:hypothetical protein